MLQNFGMVEILVIAFIIVLLFGGKKIPELARGLSKASEEFNKGLKSDKPKEETAKTKKGE